MDSYRITFHTVNRAVHINDCVSLPEANHFHIMKNNELIGEQGKLYWALKVLNDSVGFNSEIEEAMKKTNALINNRYYRCIGITYSEKHGIKIEMKINKVLYDKQKENSGFNS